MSAAHAAVRLVAPGTLLHPKYRADIDGLRAVAVTAVVGFHAFPEAVRGGFVGVDIFFVISGFLISTILYQNLERNRFSFAEFYKRRIRRIFPALILVLAATTLIGWMLLFTDEFRQLSKHVVAGAGFVSNFLLWQENGYFDVESAQKPLLHLWSLGVEEQFYIAWPLLVYLCRRSRNSLLLLSLLVGAASFALNIAWRRSDLAGTFYLPVTRLWELLAGATLANLAMRSGTFTQLRGAWMHAASVTGALIILATCGFLSESRPFPGWWAVLPTAGAVLLIWAGPAAVINKFLLSNRLLVALGLISYPVYLWHWPLMVLTSISYDDSVAARTGCVLLSILLATITYLFIERPIRTRSDNVWIPLVVGLTAIGVFGLYASHGAQSRLSGRGDPRRAAYAAYFENSVPSWKYFERIGLLQAYNEKCHVLCPRQQIHSLSVPLGGLARSATIFRSAGESAAQLADPPGCQFGLLTGAQRCAVASGLL
jgi:peptidoglycan/LPS O-acetylase OafA/YrhL